MIVTEKNSFVAGHGGADFQSPIYKNNHHQQQPGNFSHVRNSETRSNANSNLGSKFTFNTNFQASADLSTDVNMKSNKSPTNRVQNKNIAPARFRQPLQIDFATMKNIEILTVNPIENYFGPGGSPVKRVFSENWTEKDSYINSVNTPSHRPTISDNDSR